ncbi:hypothetical protein GGR56DRAFT_676452 [Xylariaceae sp. FL0804]|nr:hypothetical protein GGR56DRAFT_676452 [Xylariaceae sp. FL0804]
MPIVALLMVRFFPRGWALFLATAHAELLELEAQRRAMDADEVTGRYRGDMAALDATRRWETLLERCCGVRPERGPRGRQGEDGAHIEDEALLLQRRVAQLQAPGGRVLDVLKYLFRQPGYPIIEGKASGYLEARDLVAVKSNPEDMLMRFLRTMRVYQGRVEVTSSSSAPILALHFSRSQNLRPALVIVFAGGFAGSLALITMPSAAAAGTNALGRRKYKN